MVEVLYEFVKILMTGWHSHFRDKINMAIRSPL